MIIVLSYMSISWIVLNCYFINTSNVFDLIAETNQIFINSVASDSLGKKNYLPQKMIGVLEQFSILKSKTEKINLLIEYADNFKEVPPEIAIRPFSEENEVKYCESGAYVWTILKNDGTLKFYFAVENPQGVSARALSAILDISLTGETPADVLNVPDDVVLQIFGEDLLKGKNTGLIGILQKLKNDTKKYLN